MWCQLDLSTTATSPFKDPGIFTNPSSRGQKLWLIYTLPKNLDSLNFVMTIPPLQALIILPKESSLA